MVAAKGAWIVAQPFSGGCRDSPRGCRGLPQPRPNHVPTELLPDSPARLFHHTCLPTGPSKKALQDLSCPDLHQYSGGVAGDDGILLSRFLHAPGERLYLPSRDHQVVHEKMSIFLPEAAVADTFRDCLGRGLCGRLAVRAAAAV